MHNDSYTLVYFNDFAFYLLSNTTALGQLTEPI